jgi:Mn2+/Fe2+ NRAMP family transporter
VPGQGLGTGSPVHYEQIVRTLCRGRTVFLAALTFCDCVILAGLAAEASSGMTSSPRASSAGGAAAFFSAAAGAVAAGAFFTRLTAAASGAAVMKTREEWSVSGGFRDGVPVYPHALAASSSLAGPLVP